MDKEKLRTSLKNGIQLYCKEFFNHTFAPNNPKVKLHEPTYGAEEIWEAVDSLLTTQVTMGKKVRKFEKEFTEYFGFPHAVMVNSGSSANLLAISALCNPATPDHLKAGDEVIVPALSWSTTVWPLVQHNLVPVIVDIDPLTMNINPNEVERAISAKTRGLMPVHVYGNPCDMSAITDIVRGNSLMLIEDCCEAIGAIYDSKPVGSFGQVGSFSFYFSHHITTLEGGMCATKDNALADIMRILRAHGWVRDIDDKKSYTTANPSIDPKFLFVNSGYNFRATELQGGFGYVQLKKLRSFIDTRKENAHYWNKELEHYGDFFEFQKETPKSSHSWFGFPIMVRESAPFSVQQFTTFLNDRGIETRPIIVGNIAIQPGIKYYPHRVVGDLPQATRIMKNGLAFGNHQNIDVQARKYVINTIREFLSTLRLT